MKDKDIELQFKKAKLKNTLGIVRELLQDIDAHDSRKGKRRWRLFVI